MPVKKRHRPVPVYKADRISTDTSDFNYNLSATDLNVQECLDKLDDLGSLTDGVVAELYRDAETTLSIPTALTYEKVVGTSVGAETRPASLDASSANNNITAGEASLYMTSFSLSVEGEPYSDLYAGVFKNGVIIEKTLTEGVFSAPESVHASSVTFITGSASGQVLSDTHTENGVYYTITESGVASGINVSFTFVDPTDECGRVFFRGKYVGSNTHAVEIQAWDYTLLSGAGDWVDLRAATKDLPHMTDPIDYTVLLEIPGTLANFYNANHELIIRFYHPNIGNNSHYIDIDCLHISTMTSSVSLSGTFPVDLSVNDVIDLRVTSTNPQTVEVERMNLSVWSAKGEKGDTGATGPQGLRGVAGPGVPTGGTVGQALVKNSSVNYDTKWATVSGGGSSTYTGTAERTVGGITDGQTFTNSTMTEMWDSLIKQEKFPTLTAPSSTFTSDYTGYREVGEVIATITFNSAFDRGSINPKYTAASEYRSGLPNQYTYSGVDLTSENSTSLTNNKTISGYTVTSGAQSWTGRVAYDAGVQPKSSYDNDYSTPLAAGNTSIVTRTITGVYPYYGATVAIGTLTKQTLTSMASTYVQINMVAESGGDKQTAEFPQAWSAITGIQFYNTISATWEYINGSAANSLLTFTKTASTETIQGATIDYWKYTHNGAVIGARYTRWYTT